MSHPLHHPGPSPVPILLHTLQRSAQIALSHGSVLRIPTRLDLSVLYFIASTLVTQTSRMVLKSLCLSMLFDYSLLFLVLRGPVKASALFFILDTYKISGTIYIFCITK